MWRFGQSILSFPREGEEMIQFNHTFVVVAQLERELGDSSNFIFRRGRLDRGEIDLWGQILESLSEDAFFYDICALSCRLALHRAAIALVDANKSVDTIELICFSWHNRLWSTLGRFSPLSQYAFLPSLASCFPVPLSSSRLKVIHWKRDF